DLRFAENRVPRDRMTLDTILEATSAESANRQRRDSLATLQRKVEKMGPTRGFARALRQQPFAVIAEIKRKSPSMGVINEDAIGAALETYHTHPVVAAISVLTQSSHFGGSTDDLEKVRQLTQRRPKPILRKDFIRTDYEVYYSRWIGADAILLMANVVTDKDEFRRLHDLALSIGLDVLCEIHDASEVDLLPASAKVCGINSRRFKGVTQAKPLSLRIREKLSPFIGAIGPSRDMQTDLATFALFERLPPGSIRVAESGISSDNIADVLEKYPFNAALIGTSLLKKTAADMVRQLDTIERESARVLRPVAPAAS
ncbi:MAG: Indole-3-glycerol phosphate synthase, partial [Verrucomicrobiota bacterium]